jgi:hypothetical protein
MVDMRFKHYATILCLCCCLAVCGLAAQKPPVDPNNNGGSQVYFGPTIHGPGPRSAGDLADLQQMLNVMYKVTTTTNNMEDIDAPGDVVELQKDGLKMSALASPLAELNTYKDGKIGVGASKSAFGAFGTAMLQVQVGETGHAGASAAPNTIPVRTLASGDKCWVLAVTVLKDGILFKLLTDADNNGVRYRANLKIPFPNKTSVPSIEDAVKLVAEVLTVVHHDDPGVQPAQAPAQIISPPQPANAPPQPIVLGQTKAQVIAAFGQPVRVASLGVKEIFYYKDMKVTFTNGIVSKVE